MMKQKIYILGIATAMIVFIGTLFKINHWAGAGILLLAGIFILVFVFMPMALIDSYKSEGNSSSRILYFITWLTSLVVFISILFKVQHWSGAGYLMIVSIPFPFVVFLPVFLFVTSRNKDHSIYNTVYMLLLLMVISCFTVLLALNVSKEKLTLSLGISRNYTLAEKAIDYLPSLSQSPVSIKIDELIALTGEYRDFYLGNYGIGDSQWKDDPEIFLTSGSFQKQTGNIGRQVEEVHFKLISGLRDFIILLENTPGYETLAEAAPSVFNLRKTPGGNYNFESDLILSPSQPWLMIYLDGLETNLKMIKATIK